MSYNNEITSNAQTDDNELNAGVEIDDAAIQTVKLLLENGAIWNDVDAQNETPGCLARRLGLKELYEIMVDAGMRAEMLLNRLDEYQMLRDTDDGEDEEEGEDDNKDEGKLPRTETVKEDEQGVPDPSTDQDDDPSDSRHEHPAATLDHPNLETFLSSPLSIEPTRILDASLNGIMMSWETPLMERTATLLAPSSGLRILNIGHGMGIIDRFFQKTSPSAHHIIEAHPSILEHMRANRLWSSSSITIHGGKWQDVVPDLVSRGQLFDVIYFDTFAEDYKALRDFFSDFVISLLDERGRWGFFNGLGADRQICYDVYCKVIEMDLFEAGFDTEWTTVEVPEMEENGEWEGVRRKYWALREYRLPVCHFIG